MGSRHLGSQGVGITETRTELEEETMASLRSRYQDGRNMTREVEGCSRWKKKGKMTGGNRWGEGPKKLS